MYIKMKKKNLNWLISLLAIVSCVGFTSCDKDEEENVTGSSTDQPSVDIPSVDEDEEMDAERNENLNPQGSVASAVDLGLSVNWASHNIGAEGVYDAGGAYGWGDAQGTCYSKDNSYYPSANPPFNISGTTYDIAREKWGGTWRIPTATEFQELIDNCDVQWDASLRVLVFTSKVNGRQLILPPTLYRSGLEYYSAASNNVEGHYWTSTLYTNNTEQAYDFGFYGGAEMRISYHTERHTGIAVRPVQTNPNYVPGSDIPDTPEELIIGLWTIHFPGDFNWEIKTTFKSDGTFSVTEYYVYSDNTNEVNSSYDGEYTLSGDELTLSSPNPGIDFMSGTFTIQDISGEEMTLETIVDGAIYVYECIKD